jgi:hypothetical protein
LAEKEDVMDKDKLKALARNPNHIRGIFNYCDRWCERCTMTARCLVFAQLQEDPYPSTEEQDANESFWNRLHESFALSLELLEEMTQALGIVAEEDHDNAGEERLDREVDNHVLVLRSDRYYAMVDSFFESSSAPEDTPGDRKEIEEVILYYAPFINAKVKRAVLGLLEADPEDETSLTDALGSAKIALIASERSIASWWGMLRHVPSRASEIRDLLVRLEGVRRTIEHLFPRARSFIRPGFDKVPE